MALITHNIGCLLSSLPGRDEDVRYFLRVNDTYPIVRGREGTTVSVLVYGSQWRKHLLTGYNLLGCPFHDLHSVVGQRDVRSAGLSDGRSASTSRDSGSCAGVVSAYMSTCDMREGRSA
jgi:hypothetical protein